MAVPHDILRAFASDLLTAGGYTRDEADITATDLILSNLVGHDSHGIMRVRAYNEELQNGNHATGVYLDILTETDNSIHADARMGLGQVQMPRLLEKLFDKAKDKAVVTGSLINCGHVGRLGAWVERIAGHGYAGLCFVNDNGTMSVVAPAGGKEGRTSTNPLAFGVPLKNGRSFTIDLATSATAMGKLRLAHMADKPVPEGQLQDADGMPTTNASVLFTEPKGSILPFGGYKGFALSMMMDCLVSGLSGGFMPPAPKDTKPANNVLVCIWNPAFFAGLEYMQESAGQYLGYIRSTPAIDPDHAVRVPGDRADAVYQDRLKNGIPLEPNFHSAILRYAEQLGVVIPGILKG